MKTKLSLSGFVVTAAVVLTATFAIAAVRGPAWAAPGGDLIGSWTGGTNDEYLEWMGTHTGSTAKSGEMALNWVYVRAGLLNVGGAYPAVTRLTPGSGVWEQVGRGKYAYTWYARGVDDTPVVYYTVRVRGLATLMDDDNVSISYTYEVFSGFASPEDMSTATPVETYEGWASEIRLPLVF